MWFLIQICKTSLSHDKCCFDGLCVDHLEIPHCFTLFLAFKLQI
ncbi:hypothetical protein LINPERHAP1_LOCUS25885 [Linum perenne]